MNWRSVFPYQPSWFRWVGAPFTILFELLYKRLVGSPLDLVDTGNLYVDVPSSLLLHIIIGVAVLAVALSAVGHARARLVRTSGPPA